MPIIKKKDQKKFQEGQKRQREAELDPERQKRVQEAAQFVQERERLASQQDISSKEAGRRMVPGEELKQQERMEEQRLVKAEQAIPEQEKFFKEKERPEKTQAQKGSEEVQADVLAQEGTLQGLAPKPFRIFMRTTGVAMKQALPESLKFAGELVEMSNKINPFKSDKKLHSTKEVEDNFNNAVSALKSEIDALKDGRGDSVAARTNIRMMRRAISKFESKQKALNNSDLMYWLKDGKNIDEDIILFKQTLNDLELEAILASAGAIQ
ncbi:MAG: hypothetical protein AAB355_00305 [Patescibacteria group bacterium]